MDVGSYRVCYTCKGQKKYKPLGFMDKDCVTCNATGYVKLEIDSPDLTNGTLTANDLRIVSADSSQPVQLTPREKRMAAIAAKGKVKTKGLQNNTNQLVGM